MNNEKNKSRVALDNSALSESPVVSGVAKRPDKKVVIGETFSDDVLANFLDVTIIPEQESEDFCRMRVAYQSMPLEAFERFLDMVIARGLPVNPCDHQGRTFLSLLETHVSQNEYVIVLRAHLQNA